MKCLLDSDYVTRDEKPVIRLYYKSGKGREIVEVTDFEPYFYALSNDVESLAGLVGKLDGVVKTERVSRIVDGRGMGVLKVVVTQPKEVPRLRGEVAMTQGCRGVREADIPFARRYITDSGILPMENAENVEINVAAIDIEVYNARGEPVASRDPVIMISYADTKGLERVWTYDVDGVRQDFVEVLADEKAIIQKLVDTIREQEVDILTGYNTDNFDFPYLNDRAEKHKIELNMGFEGQAIRIERRGMNNGVRITGRPHVDMYPVCRSVFNLPRYTLEDVYASMFGEEKIDVKAGEMHEIWDSKDPDRLAEFLEYSMSDAKSTLMIALRMLPLEYELSKVVRQPLYEVSRMSSSQRVEYLLVSESFKQGRIVPNRPSDDEYADRNDGKYEGAYVVDPVRGIHDNIILFDFRSLYPSIIISHNVDPDTLNCSCCSGENKSPTGDHYCIKTRGFIPGVLEKLIQHRMDVKKRMKQETEAARKSLLDVEQQALKLLANSMYGYYGFQRARWYCRECASSITAWGRDYIHKVIKDAGENGFNVVYGDTDSVYLTLPDMEDTDEIISRSKEFQKKVNAKLPEAMDLEFEGFYPRGVFITKKRYALIDLDGKLSIKGLETRRRDWAEIAKETQKKVLDAILKDRDPEKAAEIVKGEVQRIKSGEVPLKELTINTQMTRNIGGYVSEGPHVTAAKKAMKDGREFKQGDIITYVITRRGESISDRARLVESIGEGDYDPDYYINNQLLPAVMRILEALGYTEDELKGLGKQMTLDSFN
ncbi:MAG: DNA-directed DNA polymerase [Candidatus Altiarchaeota archaeon]